MVTRDKRGKKQARKQSEPAATAEHRAPEGRGGAAMGRTVGLPFGGARARKRNPKKRAGAK